MAENNMPEEEKKEWDNALLDLMNKGLLKVTDTEDGGRGFTVADGVELVEE